MGNGGSGKRAQAYHAPCQRPFRRRRILIRVDPTSSEFERGTQLFRHYGKAAIVSIFDDGSPLWEFRI
jgi:hypothetical protein